MSNRLKLKSSSKLNDEEHTRAGEVLARAK